jgi:hypothetical protein
MINSTIQIILLFVFVVFSVPSIASPVTIYSLDGAFVENLIMEANFIDPTKRNQIIIGASGTELGSEIGLSIKSLNEAGFSRGAELDLSVINERFANGLWITYQGKDIIESEALVYDYIKFARVCVGPDQRHRLLFSLIVGGTANGNVADIIFIYYDTKIKNVNFKIIPKRYLEPLCDMEGATENKRLEDKKIRELNLIFEQLQTPGQSPDLEALVKTGNSLPTRQISYQAFERLLDEARHLVPAGQKTESEEGSEGEDYFESTFVFEDLAENARWRVVEFSYLQLWSSWGVLLVQDKLTNQWTAFYTSSAGDSNLMLYLDNQVELQGDHLTGKFNPYAQQTYVISLEDFDVHQQ